MRTNNLLNAIRTTLCVLLTALPATAQDGRWDLVDTGILSHPIHGNGIAISFAIVPFRDGKHRNDEVLVEFAKILCSIHAPSVIRNLRQRTDIGEPNFFEIRIVIGRNYTQEFRQTFVVLEDTCGEKL